MLVKKPRQTKARTSPLNWKPEHRLALAIAISLGAFVGAIVAFMLVQPHAGSFGMHWRSFPRGYWFPIIFWPTAGALIGGAVMIILRLSRPEE